MIIMRKAKPSDMKQVSDILCATNLEGAAEASCHIMVSENEGALMGVGGIKINGDNARLKFIAFLPEFENQGFEDALVRSLINYSDRRGVENLYADDSYDLAILSEVGFKKCGNGMVLNIAEFFGNLSCRHDSY